MLGFYLKMTQTTIDSNEKLWLKKNVIRGLVHVGQNPRSPRLFEPQSPPAGLGS